MNPSNETELRIQSFLNRLTSDLKDEKTYSIDSAIWYTEASLNFTYAIYDSALVYIAIDTNEFSVDLDENDKVTESDLDILYEDMVDSLEAFYDNLYVNIKRVFYCDVVVIDIAEGRLDLIMVGVIACGYSSYQWSYFDEDDYWFSIMEWGKCNYYEGEGDAAIQLTQAFMSNLCLSDPEVRIWFSDEITRYAESSDYYYPPAPYGHRAFWYSGIGQMQYPQCLSPEDLEYYLSDNGIPYIIDDQNPDPENLEFESISVPSNGYLGGVGWWIEYHNMFITYGVRNETQVPASEL